MSDLIWILSGLIFKLFDTDVIPERFFFKKRNVKKYLQRTENPDEKLPHMQRVILSMSLGVYN